MSDAQRVLLIGGSGFMGPHVARAFLDAGHRVAVLSRGTHPPPEGVEALTADRKDPASLAAVLENQRFDITVDFLAFDAADIERLLLVPYAALGRYFMISTGQVYLVTSGATPPFREDDAQMPVIPEPEPNTRAHAGWRYGVAKRRAEGALFALRASHGVRAAALRLPIVQGEGDSSLRLWGYLERMLDGGPIVLPEGGAQLRRFLYVGDLARALVALAAAPPARAAAYNLAQPDVLTLREFLERAAHAAGVTPQFVDASWDDIGAAGLDEGFSPFSGRAVSLLDPSRAAAEWGFLGTRVDEYLPQVVRWHLEHRPPSDMSYAFRPQELELAGRLAGARR